MVSLATEYLSSYKEGKSQPMEEIGKILVNSSRSEMEEKRFLSKFKSVADLSNDIMPFLCDSKQLTSNINLR